MQDSPPTYLSLCKQGGEVANVVNEWYPLLLFLLVMEPKWKNYYSWNITNFLVLLDLTNLWHKSYPFIFLIMFQCTGYKGEGVLLFKCLLIS